MSETEVVEAAEEAAEAGAEEAGSAGNEEDTSEERTFTQEEVNAIVQKRVAKFSDYDEVKKELETLKANSADTNKAIDAAREEGRKEGQAAANKRVLESDTRYEALKMGFLYPEDAHMYCKFDDSDEVSTEDIRARLQEVVSERPALVRSESTPTAADAGLGATGAGRKKTNAERFSEMLSH